MRINSTIKEEKLETISVPKRYGEMFCLGFCSILIVMCNAKLCGFLAIGFNLLAEKSSIKATVVLQAINISAINLLGLGILLIMLLKSISRIKKVEELGSDF